LPHTHTHTHTTDSANIDPEADKSRLHFHSQLLLVFQFHVTITLRVCPRYPSDSFHSVFHSNMCLCLPYLIHVVQDPGICHPQLCHPNRIWCRAAMSEIWPRSSTQQALQPYNAARDLISATRNKNMLNSTHYCFIRFPPQMYSEICCNTVSTTYFSYQNTNRRPISNVTTAQPSVAMSQISPDSDILVTNQQGQTSH
jgi:hypothetical protein